MAKSYGVSRKVNRAKANPINQDARYSNRSSSSSTTQVMGAAARAADRDQTRERVRQIMSGCSRDTIELLNDNTRPDPEGQNFVIDVDYDYKNENDWEDLPPNLQADDAFVHALRDIPLVKQRGRYTKGTKTWRQRRLREEARWAELIEPLTDAFVEWRFGPSADVPPRPDEPVARPEVPTREDEPVVPPIDEDVPMEYVWTVEHAFDLFTLVEDIKINRREDHPG
ncbi:hypothetical protein BC629DRAFT_1441403 [Irpex lacteus]|nr:hypothetical protein BC629DRAFT_1441403 [Irpex lacteus]